LAYANVGLKKEAADKNDPRLTKTAKIKHEVKIRNTMHKNTHSSLDNRLDNMINLFSTSYS